MLGADDVQAGLGGVGAILGSLQLALEAAHTGGGLLGDTLLLGQLAAVDVDLGSGLVQRVLQQDEVLLVLLALHQHLLDGALLLAQNLDGLGVAALLLLQLQLQIADAGFQLADDALAAGDGVQLDLLQADGQVLRERLEGSLSHIVPG